MAKIILIEDRFKQGLVFTLNLYVYLGADVFKAKNLEQFSRILDEDSPFDLIICREIMGEKVVPFIKKALEEQKFNVPIVALGKNLDNLKDVTFVDDPLEVRSLLHSSARILSITPLKMVNLDVPEYYPVQSSFFLFLIYFPCDVFTMKEGDYQKIFEKDELIDKNLISEIINSQDILYIDSIKRVRFTDSFTEQFFHISHLLQSEQVDLDRKIQLMDKTLDHISREFQREGSDYEVVELARNSVSSLVKLTESFDLLTKLRKKLLSNKCCLRFTLAQIVTYIAFHILKYMGWWYEDLQRGVAFAALYHDILLEKDDDIRIRTNEELHHSALDVKEKRIIENHARKTSKLLSKIPLFPHVGLEIVKQHHGATIGEGFYYDYFDISPIAKVFLVAEEWALRILHLNIEEDMELLEGDEYLLDLKLRLNDPCFNQIFQTLKYIDSHDLERIFSDFVKVKGNIVDIDEYFRERGSAEDENKDKWSMIKFYAEKADSALGKGAKCIEGDEKILMKGVTKKVEDISYLVKGDGYKDDFNNVMRVKKVGQKIDKASQFINDNKERIEQIGKKIDNENLNIKSDLFIAAEQGNLPLVKKYVEQSEKNIRFLDKAGRNVLHFAAKSGKIEVIEYLIRKGVGVNSVDAQKRSSLFYALMHDQEKCFHYLVKIGARIEHKAMGGVNLAMASAYKGNFSILKYLIYERRLGIHHRDSRGKSVMDYAQKGGKQQIINFLKKQKK